MPENDPSEAPLTRSQRGVLLGAAAVASACGLSSELLLGDLASYLGGDRTLAYGMAVGIFLAAMGLGAYLSRFVAVTDARESLLRAFVAVELAIAPLSALLPMGLFALFAIEGPLWLGLILATLCLGVLAGMEIPLLTRVLEREEGARDALSSVLALDYLGALVGSLAFPIVLLPLLGLLPAAAAIAVFPAAMTIVLGTAFPSLQPWRVWGAIAVVGLLAWAPLALVAGDRMENVQYGAPIVTRVQSPYQRIVLTRQGSDLRLFLDGDLQLSTVDEYRYHEALIHPALAAHGHPRRVLLLGAGDGMALREVLKWPEVERVVLIDLDGAVVNLARTHPFLRRVNGDAFADPRVEVRVADAFAAVPHLTETFDAIVADFPDPDRDDLAKLYALGFYRRLLPHLAPDGVFVTQASSPFFAPKVMACIAATLRAAGLRAYPYAIDVPSFGPWGFVLATQQAIDPATFSLPVPTRFLSRSRLVALFDLPPDLEVSEAVDINRLDRPVLVRYQADPRWTAY